MQNATTSNQPSVQSGTRVTNSDPNTVTSEQSSGKLTASDGTLLPGEVQQPVNVLMSVINVMTPTGRVTESVPDLTKSKMNWGWIPATATPLNTYIMTIGQYEVQRTVRLGSYYGGKYL
jgi:hypothetical protein